jgi:CRISPR-associated protein Csd1
LSWISNLADTYDRVASIAGIPDDDGITLAPPSHMHAKTNICVTIDGSGNFLRATKDKEKESVTITIPCTENSSGRTSGICAHPLHDQLGYLALGEKKRNKYLEQLSHWCGLHVKVAAVYKYVAGNTIISDLERSGIEIKAKDDKLFVRFRVEIPGDLEPNLWLDQSVINVWQNYYESTFTNSEYCYVTGKFSPFTSKHPKGINPATNGAKLISCNDETDYTYRGRFSKAEQVNTISYGASQKAHAMLRYLIEKHGRRCDTQAIAVWALDSNMSSELPIPFDNSFDIYGKTAQTDNSNQISIAGELDTDYALKLRSALQSYGGEARLREHRGKIAVIAVDAATTGRMGVTFYQELN